MKNIKIIIFLVLLSSGLFAKNMYVGIGMMGGSGKQTLKYDGNTYKADYDTSASSFKFGFILRNQNRIEFSVNKFDITCKDSSWTDTYTGYDINYLWTFLNRDQIQPYIGLGFGLYTSDNMYGQNIKTGDIENASALALVLSGGVLFNIEEHIELEVNFNYHNLRWNYEDFDLSDDISTIYVGVNYKF